MTGETIKFLVGRPDLGNWRRPYSSLDQITASKITHCHLTFAFVAFLWQRSALCLFKMSCSFWTVLYSSDCLWPFSCTFQPPSKHYFTHRICKFVNLHLWLEHFPTCLIHNTNTVIGSLMSFHVMSCSLLRWLYMWSSPEGVPTKAQATVHDQTPLTLKFASAMGQLCSSQAVVDLHFFALHSEAPRWHTQSFAHIAYERSLSLGGLPVWPNDSRECSQSVTDIVRCKVKCWARPVFAWVCTYE